MEGIVLIPRRNSDCSLAGTTAEIESDVIIPETRIPSTPEQGSESCSGDVSTEFNIDEQDDWLEAVFCGEWKDDDSAPSGTSRKVLTLGDKVTSFSMLKKYSQNPAAFQLFKKCFINQLTIDLATDNFVKLSWNIMGSNNPIKVLTDPLSALNPEYREPMTTKSYITRSGFLQIGDDIDSLVAMRQASSMSTTINNNMEATPALFEQESIENSLGDFDVDGSIDVYNADDIGNSLYNDCVEGKDKVIRLQFSRKVGATTTSYTLTMNVRMEAPTESKNGNKLQFAAPFKLNAVKDLSFVKEVY